MSTETLGTVAKPDEPIKWITPAEAERFERMLFKNYVRKFPNGVKPPKDQGPKEYFYKIVSIRPVSPANVTTSDEQFTLLFELQKYYRNRTKKVNKRDSVDGPDMETEQNEPVKRWESNRLGNYVLVDADASFPIDTRLFEQQFVPDNG